MALMQTFQDNFDFGGIDAGKWTISGGSQVIGNTNLQVELRSSLGGNYVSISSISTYDLTGSYAFCQVVDAGNQGITSWEVYPIYLIADANNKVFIRIATNTVQPIKVVANVTTNVGTGVTYNPATMKYFRIRESGGTTFFDYAADPTGTWTNIASLANPITLTALTAEILVGTWQAETLQTSAKLDNFNVTPTQYQFTWSGYSWNKRIHAGPAANNQSWSASNISGPDGNGYLTLALTNPGSAPVGCEIFSVNRNFGYGVYTLTVGTRLDNIDPASCFGGMFLFDFTAPPDYKEIDCNETRDYQQQTTKNILHSHVYNNGGSALFITDSANYPSNAVQTHRMIWTPTKISFDSFIGADTTGVNYFHTDHTTHLPIPGMSRVHFNVFVDVTIAGFATVAPLNVILQSFSFTPYAGNRKAVAGRVAAANRQVSTNRSLASGRTLLSS